MTRTEMSIRAAIFHLKDGPMTCSNLGSMLWGKSYRNQQSYARPAGKLFHEMKRQGLVRRFFDGHFFLWELVHNWELKLKNTE